MIVFLLSSAAYNMARWDSVTKKRKNIALQLFSSVFGSNFKRGQEILLSKLSDL
jgi:hypothetical protein